jgi:hypothetical protein
MIHERHGLLLRLKAGNDIFGVHAQLDDFEGNAPADWFLLFGHINDTAAPFAYLLEEFIIVDAVFRLFEDRFAANRGFGRRVWLNGQSQQTAQTAQA